MKVAAYHYDSIGCHEKLFTTKPLAMALADRLFQGVWSLLFHQSEKTGPDFQVKQRRGKTLLSLYIARPNNASPAGISVFHSLRFFSSIDDTFQKGRNWRSGTKLPNSLTRPKVNTDGMYLLCGSTMTTGERTIPP